MGVSHRIRTEIGINKTINVELEQDFNSLEILSLKIQQEDVYTKSCADYGVLVGRVTANNGFGLPNARVSVFIPIENVDKSNPLITSIYPYTTPEDKNEDGYRYNLLSYEKSYPSHAATGTFPSVNDVLTGKTAIEIYDKYYKYTVKTNDSGDYMIMGAPLGTHIVFLDLDLSDIGEFSLTPQDLIRMGRATEAQVAGANFKESTDLNSLPQIVSLSKSVDISPLWGDQSICQIAITRTDFDLRDDANIDIQPTAAFMGSVFSSPDNFRIRKNCKPRDNMGNLCGLITSPGQVLAIRQTSKFDTDGNPVLEQYQLEQSGNIIDASGTWLTELPMNLDYVVTNEFGEAVISNNPTVGIPTKGKYRFKIKWKQPPKLTEQVRRAYFLVPNVREYGWISAGSDPTPGYDANVTNYNSQQLQQLSSYYFGLDWSGYTNGFISTKKTDKLNDAINCEDTFYEFKYNRVYTISGLIDEYKYGAKGRFVGIKEIDDSSCEDSVNKFPVNDGFRNFDFLYFIFSLLLIVIQPIAIAVLFVGHVLLWLYLKIIQFACWVCRRKIPVINVYPFRGICTSLGINCDERSYTIRLPMITYPECQACDCPQETTVKPTSNSQIPASGNLSYFSSSDFYINKLNEYWINDTRVTDGDESTVAEIISYSMGGNSSIENLNSFYYKTPFANAGITLPTAGGVYSSASKTLPIGERINLFNQRQNYFNGLNKIKVTFAKDYNSGTYHNDNTLTVISTSQYDAGTLLTFVNPLTTNDVNFTYTANTKNGIVTGISGTSYNSSAATTINVSYATTRYTNTVKSYNLPYGSEETNYKYPQDREYYQVITAITMSQAMQIWNNNAQENSFPGIINKDIDVDWFVIDNASWRFDSTFKFKVKDYYEDFDNQYMLILQRGVDPYSPYYINEYDLSTLFGYNSSQSGLIVTASTRVNIPIQKQIGTTTSVQSFASQENVFYQSYFFKPGTQALTYFTSGTSYYGKSDTIYQNPNQYLVGPELKSLSTNGFYDSSINSNKYGLNEDLSGLGFMFVNNYSTSRADYFSDGFREHFNFAYYSNTIKTTYPTMIMSNPTLNVMRTDRLPSSDNLDGYDWSKAALLQQNLEFAFYQILDGEDIGITAFNLGADIVTPDIEGLPAANVVASVGSCEEMVQLNCYEGLGTNFQINQACAQGDAVERGCYLFMRRPLTDLFPDIKNFAEYCYRFRFFYGLCRGVLAQSFVNNWINGSLYAFPIQVDTTFDSQNKPKSKYCSDLVYFDKTTTNFYYRSSPYNDSTDKFIGKKATKTGNVNDYNLLYPTTIINMGVKASFYKYISFDASANDYIMTELDTSSYSDTSDLVNLFVISRITDASFLGQIFAAGDNSLNQLFTRKEKRIDGDLAQLMSINSEVGVIKFSPEFYETVQGSTTDPVNILGTPGDPITAVWFSSTTEDLQLKDNITPGKITFRPDNLSTYVTYQYGIKSQIVPFYQWKLANTNTIFGGQYNTWATSSSDIIKGGYQSTDRTNRNTLNPTYFQSNTSPTYTDLYERGYIFSVDNTGVYSPYGAANSKFIVGAPFHFYFGVVKGDSALDKFKIKYGIVE
jgi:hypothetical protein